MLKHVIIELDARDLQKSDVPVLHLVFCVTNTHILQGLCSLSPAHEQDHIYFITKMATECGCSLVVRIPRCGRGDLGSNPSSHNFILFQVVMSLHKL